MLASLPSFICAVRDLIYTRSGIIAGTLFCALVPAQAAAVTFTQVVGLFHIVVGLLLTFILLFFATSVAAYVSRFNTWPNNRDEAIRMLEWAVTMLFVLIVLLAIVRYVQTYPEIALPILAFIVVVVAAIFIVRVVVQSKQKPPESGRK